MWLLMAIATKQMACSSVPLALGCEVTGLININGGHSNAYIRNVGPGSVPKIANAITFYFAIIILAHLENHSLFRLFSS